VLCPAPAVLRAALALCLVLAALLSCRCCAIMSCVSLWWTVCVPCVIVVAVVFSLLMLSYPFSQLAVLPRPGHSMHSKWRACCVRPLTLHNHLRRHHHTPYTTHHHTHPFLLFAVGMAQKGQIKSKVDEDQLKRCTLPLVLSCLSLASLLPLSCLSLASLLPLSCLSLASLLPLSCLSLACSLSLASLFPLAYLSLASLLPLSCLSFTSLLPL
jgi:hypothetical protein